MGKRKENEDEEVLYCLCRRPANDSFMIACDKCEEWFHGECIDLDESDAKYIKEFFCQDCSEAHPECVTRFSKKRDKEQSRKRQKEKKREKERVDKKVKKKRKARIYSSDEDEPMPQKSSKKAPMDPSSIFSDDEGDDNFEQFMSSVKEKEKKEPVSKVSKDSFIEDEEEFEPDSTQDMEDSFDLDDTLTKKKKKVKEKLPPQQCFGPKCVQQARRRSKYCSDACGLAMASARIDKFLVPKIDDIGKIPSVSEIELVYKLTKLEKKYYEEEARKNDLEKKFKFLEELITFSRTKSINRDAENVEAKSETDEQMFCPICGHLSGSKIIIKHINKCYRKIESATAYFSAAETIVDGSKRLFCDFYNARTGTFCKRLKVMCPEHYNDPKVLDENEVCGCPFVTSGKDFYEIEQIEKINYCQLSKKACKRHYLWEKFYRASNDVSRVRALTRMMEISKEMYTIKSMIQARKSAVLLMFNETIRHTDVADFRPDSRKMETDEIYHDYCEKKDLNASLNLSQESIMNTSKMDTSQEDISVT